MTTKIGGLLEHYFIAARHASHRAGEVELSPTEIAAAMRRGSPPPDETFDRYLPPEVRAVSGMYWTPLVVARRAAEWLGELGVRSVVDIGSGAGKFCVSAALAGEGAFVGIEHRPRLVEVARELSRTFGVEDRVSFVEDALGEGPVPAAEAYYLYNPFGENQYWCGEHLDDEVELSEDRFTRDVSAAEALFREAPLGTYVLTYNGFGGLLPPDYQRLRVDRTLPNMLRLWQRTGVRRTTPMPLDGD